MTDVAGWATAQGQLEAEALMTEPGRIDRVLGVTSDEHGRPVAELLDPPVYVGPAKVRSYRPQETSRDVAGSTATTQVYDLHIPAPERMAPLQADGRVTAWNGPVRAGDFLTISPEGGPEQVFRITGEHDVTYQTAQRLLGTHQTGGITA